MSATTAAAAGDAIPKKALVVEVRILQGRGVACKKEPFVMAKVGGDEVFRTRPAKKSKEPKWRADEATFALARYDAEEDGPLYFELAAGSDLNVLGRSLVPLDPAHAHKSQRAQPPVWTRVAGGGACAGAELQVAVLAVDALRDGELSLARDRAVRAVLVQDLLLLFGDPPAGRALRRRVALGPGAQLAAGPGPAEFRVVEDPAAAAAAPEEVVLRASSDADAAEWVAALRPFVGTPPPKPCFGVALQDVLERERSASGGAFQPLPSVFEELLDTVAATGVSEPGIFRLGGTEVELDDAVRRIEVGGPVVAPWDTPHITASLLKRFLRSLPEPLLPASFLAVPTRDTSVLLERLKELVWQLPEANREILKALMKLARQVHAERKTNMMDAKNLAVVLGPSLLWDQDAQQAVASAPKGKSKSAISLEALGALTNASKVCALTEALILWFDVVFENAPIPATAPLRSLNIRGVKAAEEVTQQAIEIFAMYESGGVLLEQGFLSFTEDLAAMPKAKRITAAEATKMFTGLVKDKKKQPHQVSREDFLKWWTQFHAHFLPV